MTEESPTFQDVDIDRKLIEDEAKFQAQLHKDPLLGTLLDDKYQILDVLGFGGMSVVYRALQQPVDRLVAIKTVKFRVDERPDIWRRFEREVRTLSKLSHPNVVTVYDCVIGKDQQPYVVMDCLQGFPLDHVLLNSGAMPLARIYSVASQVCQGVAHAHRNEVIHRDIKPANIMLLDQSVSGSHSLTNAGEQLVKVVDFGLAKLGEDSRKLTHSGELWGSPPYMSPEQICGRECDVRTDIYSLGCVVYEMATGKDPFWGANVYELLHCHLHNQPAPLAKANPEADLPLQLEQVIFKAMAKEPADRFASMGEFREALEEACLRPGSARSVYVETANTPAPPAHTPDQKSGSGSNHLLTVTLTLMMVFACILFAINMGGQMENTRTKRIVNPAQPSVSAPVSPAAIEQKTAPADASDIEPVVRAAGERSEGQSRFRHNSNARKAVSHHAAGVLPTAKTIKQSSPNSPVHKVETSKFDILRRMKSTATETK